MLIACRLAGLSALAAYYSGQSARAMRADAIPQREALAPRAAHKAARFFQHPQRGPAAAPGACPGLSAGRGG
jgi:hypothetical protein